ASAAGSRSPGTAVGQAATMTESPPVKAVHSSSVTNGMIGWMSLSSWSSTCPSTWRVRPAAAGSGPFRVGLASSTYQSQNSSQAKWYKTSLTLANSNSSNSAPASAMTAASPESIHRSGTLSAARSAAVRSPSAPSPQTALAPLMSANLAAFQSLLQKLRAPATHSSLSATSPPGLAPLARVNRVASAPNRSIQSSGSTVLPRDLDIFLPSASRTRPCKATCRNGTDCSGPASAIAYRPNSIIRATQKNKMSYPVTSTLVG